MMDSIESDTSDDFNEFYKSKNIEIEVLKNSDNEEEQETSNEPYNELREFYRIPENSRLKVRYGNEDITPPLTTVIPEITTEEKEPSEVQVSEISGHRRHHHNKDKLNRLLQLELEGWIGHLLYINKVADDPFIKALILSSYSIGDLFNDPVRIFLFFTKNFTTYEVPRFRWLIPIDVPQGYSVIGFYRQFISRTLRRRKCSKQLLNLLFVSLCRCLGLHARLIMSFPSSEIKMSSKDPSDPNSCLVHPPPAWLRRQWLGLPEPEREKSKKNKRHATSSPQQTVVRSSFRWNYAMSVWAEVFWRKEKRWISLDVGQNLFDFGECTRTGRRYKNGISKRLLLESEETTTKLKEHMKSSDRTCNSRSQLQSDVEQQKIKSSWVRDENEEELVETEDEKVAETELKIKTNEGGFPTSSARFNSLLLAAEASDEDEDRDDDEDGENDKGKITQKFSYEPRSSLLDNPHGYEISGPPLKKKKVNRFYSIIDPTEEPLSPETSFDLEVDRIILGDAIASAWAAKPQYRGKRSPQSELRSITDQPMVLRKPGTSASTSNDTSNVMLHTSCSFMLAVNAGGLLRDVTRRYQQRWSDVISSRGCLHEYLSRTLDCWNQLLQEKQLQILKTTILVDALDEFALQDVADQEPIPLAKTKFKRHPKFVLESMLPSTEIIAPREPVLGYFNGEAVFPRRNVRSLYSIRQWSERFNRCIRENEEPLRRLEVSRRSKSDDNGGMIVDLYAEWQTEIIPRQVVGQDGKIPCTEFGNVNLIGSKEPPMGCVHLSDYPGITYIVRKLDNVEWRPALTGFDFNQSGKPTPIINGVVILEKDKDIVLNEYQKYYDRKMNYEYARYQQRTLNLWRTLFKALLGRYYRAAESSQQGSREEVRASFRHAKSVIDSYSQSHVSNQQNDNHENEQEVSKWEELC